MGEETINNLINCFKSEGYTLSSDGTLSAAVLENLSEIETVAALKAYANRSNPDIEDAALLTGTSKDLMEAVAKHVILIKMGIYPNKSNFPTLMGQAFMELGLAANFIPKQENEPIQCRVERAIFELACSINSFRNKEGTGHGRPFFAEY